MIRPAHRERGNAALEAGLILPALLFLVFSGAEILRGIWLYHTLASSTTHGARYAVVHGARCVDAAAACQATISDIAGAVRRASAGIDFNDLELIFAAGTDTRSCRPATNCLNDSTKWPASPNNAVGQSMSLTASYTYRPSIAALWPGQSFQSIQMRTQSVETIQF